MSTKCTCEWEYVQFGPDVDVITLRVTENPQCTYPHLPSDTDTADG